MSHHPLKWYSNKFYYTDRSSSSTFQMAPCLFERKMNGPFPSNHPHLPPSVKTRDGEGSSPSNHSHPPPSLETQDGGVSSPSNNPQIPLPCSKHRTEGVLHHFPTRQTHTQVPVWVSEPVLCTNCVCPSQLPLQYYNSTEP